MYLQRLLRDTALKATAAPLIPADFLTTRHLDADVHPFQRLQGALAHLPPSNTKYPPGSCIYHPLSKTHTNIQCKNGPRHNQHCHSSNSTRSTTAAAYSTMNAQDQPAALSALVSEQSAQISPLKACFSHTSSVNDTTNYLPVPAILYSAASDHLGPPSLKLHSHTPSKQLVQIEDVRISLIRRTEIFNIPTAQWHMQLRTRPADNLPNILVSVTKLAQKHAVLFLVPIAYLFPRFNATSTPSPTLIATLKRGLYQIDTPAYKMIFSATNENNRLSLAPPLTVSGVCRSIPERIHHRKASPRSPLSY